MKFSPFKIKVKYDNIPIVDKWCDTIDEVDEEIKIMKKKFK